MIALCLTLKCCLILSESTHISAYYTSVCTQGLWGFWDVLWCFSATRADDGIACFTSCVNCAACCHKEDGQCPQAMLLIFFGIQLAAGSAQKVLTAVR